MNVERYFRQITKRINKHYKKQGYKGKNCYKIISKAGIWDSMDISEWWALKVCHC